MKNLTNLKVYKNRCDVPNNEIVLVNAEEADKEIERLNKEIARLKNPMLKNVNKNEDKKWNMNNPM